MLDALDSKASYFGLDICDTLDAVPFRHLVSLYNTHITHTPMILAQEFSRSATGRRSDFSTSASERGIFTLTERACSPPKAPRKRRVRGSLIAQFAASDAKTFADACELIHPFADGVDLNCGRSILNTGHSNQLILTDSFTATSITRLSTKMGVSREDWILPSPAARNGEIFLRPNQAQNFN